MFSYLTTDVASIGFMTIVHVVKVGASFLEGLVARLAQKGTYFTNRIANAVGVDLPGRQLALELGRQLRVSGAPVLPESFHPHELLIAALACVLRMLALNMVGHGTRAGNEVALLTLNESNK